MSLHLHRAERAGRLVDGLAEILAIAPSDTFAIDLVAVPTPGVERWLAQRLASRLGATPGHSDGVCVGIEFPPVANLLATALHPGSQLSERVLDPWHPQRAVWPLLEVVDASRSEQFAALLWAYLTRGARRLAPGGGPGDSGEAPHPSGSSDFRGAGDDHSVGGRRWTTAYRLAALFDRYAAERPSMMRRWMAGEDTDAWGRPLPADRAWQAELWRRLRGAINSPSPVERMDSAVERLSDDPSTCTLPERLSVFGLTRLDVGQARLLTALAAHREVHLWLPHASPALWDAIGERLLARDVMIAETPEADLITPAPAGAAPARLSPDRVSPARSGVGRTRTEPGERPSGTANPIDGHGGGIRPRTDDGTALMVRHRLLAHLGRDLREVQLTLADALPPDTGVFDQHLPGGLGRPTVGDDRRCLSLLETLQRDLAADSPPAPADRPTYDPSDCSVSVHLSHGPDRQVEVLRELLVGLLADDLTLEPRDIVVMCPDVETFAPHIVAAFGVETTDAGWDHPGHRLRVRLADRSLRQVNPVLDVAVSLLALVSSRMERSAVLDLAALPPVARKFGFREDDLARMRDLVTAAGVRWGLDADDRRRYQMGAFGQNTWSAGLDRLLLGIALDESTHQHLGTALPLDDVDSGDVDLIGRLAEFIARLRALSRQAQLRQPIAAWVRLLREALADVTSTTRADAWQSTQAYGLLAGLAEQGVDSSAELSLAEVTALVADQVRGRPGRANFRTGTITVCTMLPMRSVPHRVVCLLGVDDGVFPRRVSIDGDDLVALRECVGDRNPAGEDRQLLLDAIMAAEQRLIVVYGGRDPRTGASRPPAVPIGELLDAIDSTMRLPAGTPVSKVRIRDQITVVHPLQPFDPAYFGDSGDHRPSGSGVPTSFDVSALAGAHAARGARRPPQPVFDTQPLPVEDGSGSVELADLIRFYGHPAKALLRRRGSIYRGSERLDEPDEIPTALDSLGQWWIGQRFLDQHLAGADLDTLVAAEWRRGQLPPRRFGAAVLDTVTATVVQIAAVAAPLQQGPAERLEVATDCDGQPLSGTVGGVYGHDLVRVHYGRLHAKHRLDAWIEVLALSLTYPDRPWQALLVGRKSSSRIGPVDRRWSQRAMTDLLMLYRSGLTEPTPFAPKTSAEYADWIGQGQAIDPIRIRRLGETWSRERDDAYGCFYGPELDDLMADPARELERQRQNSGESSRFGVLAGLVFRPLLLKEAAL